MKADTAILDDLKTKLGSNNFLLDTYTRGLLTGVYDYIVAEVTLQPDGVDEDWEWEDMSRNALNEDATLLVEHSNQNIPAIYPNPVSGKLTIANSHLNEIIEVKIVDLSGKLLISKLCSGQCYIDVSTLDNGIYLINLYKEGSFLKSKKLAVMH